MRHTVEPDCVRAFHALELDGLGALDRSSGPRPSALQSPVGDSQSHLRLRHHHLPQLGLQISVEIAELGKIETLGKWQFWLKLYCSLNTSVIHLLLIVRRFLDLKRNIIENSGQVMVDHFWHSFQLTPLFELMSECNFAAREGFLIFANLPKSFAKLPKRRGRGEGVAKLQQAKRLRLKLCALNLLSATRNKLPSCHMKYRFPGEKPLNSGRWS